MTEEKRPYAQFYDQGHTAGVAGVSVDQCPYRPIGENRLELLARRVAWLEGHADGLSQRHQELEAARAREAKVQVIPRAAPGTLAPSSIASRYWRRKLRAAGGPERYVDRRLRQIAEEQQLELPRSRRVSSGRPS